MSNPPLSPITTAMGLVKYHIQENHEKTDPPLDLELGDDVYLVWFCYILGGWKALVSTTLPDGMYYEVTFNRHSSEAYVDAYKKFRNQGYPIDKDGYLKESNA